MEDATTSQTAHSAYEDLSAILMGTCFLALGLEIVSKAGLLSGGLPGLALLVCYATGIKLWILVPLFNIPFFILAAVRLDLMASLRSVLSIAMLTGLIKETPHWLQLETLSPLYASILGGMLLGFGLLALFRHSTTVGGFSVLAYYVQENLKIRSGYFQLMVDALILGSALFLMDPHKVGLSAIAALVMSFVLIINHKPNRYLGKSKRFGPGIENICAQVILPILRLSDSHNYRCDLCSIFDGVIFPEASG